MVSTSMASLDHLRLLGQLQTPVAVPWGQGITALSSPSCGRHGDLQKTDRLFGALPCGQGRTSLCSVS